MYSTRTNRPSNNTPACARARTQKRRDHRLASERRCPALAIQIRDRLELHGELNVQALVDGLPGTQQNVSSHLRLAAGALRR